MWRALQRKPHDWCSKFCNAWQISQQLHHRSHGVGLIRCIKRMRICQQWPISVRFGKRDRFLLHAAARAHVQAGIYCASAFASPVFLCASSWRLDTSTGRHAGDTLQVRCPRLQDSARTFHGSKRAHFQFVDYRMSLRRTRMPDGSQKQPARFRGKFVSEQATQTEAHLAVSLVAEMVLHSALQNVPQGKTRTADAAISDEALHALLATVRYVQQNGLLKSAVQHVQDALGAVAATRPVPASSSHASMPAHGGPAASQSPRLTPSMDARLQATNTPGSWAGNTLSQHTTPVDAALQAQSHECDSHSSEGAGRFEEIKQLLLMDDWGTQVC